MLKRFFSFLLLFIFFVGCTVKTPHTQNLETLTRLLYALNTQVPIGESKHLAKNIYQKVATLTKEFALTSPPSYHNFLVNIGIKEKGLCYHWSDALYTYLSTQNHPSFAFHQMGANIGEYWQEHNVLVVVSKGQSVEEGIVIDPWRNSGVLYFSKVKEDSKYNWIHRPTRGCQSTL